MSIAARLDEFGKPAWIALMILGLLRVVAVGPRRSRFHNREWTNGLLELLRHEPVAGQEWISMRKVVSTGGELLLPQAVIALSTNIASIRCADSRKNSASLRSSYSDCALPRTGPSSTSSWPSGATVPRRRFATAIPAVRKKSSSRAGKRDRPALVKTLLFRRRPSREDRRRQSICANWIVEAVAGSLGFDVGEVDHLTPLLSFVGDQLTEVSR